MVFYVELASNAEDRAIGLMNRPDLDREQGMLFIYQEDSVPGFWMRNMLIPLDIVWIDSEGVVAGVTPDVLPALEGSQPSLYYPPRPVRYVLEITAGLAAEVGIGPGSSATFVEIPHREK